MLTEVCNASRARVTTRIVEWLVASMCVPNQLLSSDATYGTTPVSTDATVMSNATP